MKINGIEIAEGQDAILAPAPGGKPFQVSVLRINGKMALISFAYEGLAFQRWVFKSRLRKEFKNGLRNMQ